MEELLKELVTRLKDTYGTDLVSVVLYGSAVATDHQKKHSDLNVFCMLDHVGVAELRKGEKTVRWWIKQKQPPPLIFSDEEIHCYHEVFPIEFLDIQQNHRVLYGSDPVASIQVDRTNHRRQVEHELSANLLRLRQKYMAMQATDKDILQLMMASIASFSTLARHALIIADGSAPLKKAEIFQAAAARFGLEAAPFQTVLAMRDGTGKPSGQQIHALFASYLEQITKLEEVLDQI